MSKVFLIIICITAPLTSLSCQSGPNWAAIDKKNHIVKRVTVTSKYKTLDDSRVLRFKNDLVVITVNIPDIIEYFENHFKEYPNLRDEKVLAERFSNESNTHSEYDFEDFSRRERDRLYFCLASLLEKGMFIITMRSSVETVFEIIACEYSHIRGPLDGVGGRVFFLKDGREFFGVCDWIS